LLWIPYAAVDYFYYHGQMDIRTCYPWYLLLAIIFIRIAIVSFLRPDIAVPIHAPFVSRPLAPAELKRKSTWLKKVVKENCYYQDPELSLGSLAGRSACDLRFSWNTNVVRSESRPERIFTIL
jgi:hypothetical protein